MIFASSTILGGVATDIGAGGPVGTIIVIPVVECELLWSDAVGRAGVAHASYASGHCSLCCANSIILGIASAVGSESRVRANDSMGFTALVGLRLMPVTPIRVFACSRTPTGAHGCA